MARDLITFLVAWSFISVLVALIWAGYVQMRAREQERELRRFQAAWRRASERRDHVA